MLFHKVKVSADGQPLHDAKVPNVPVDPVRSVLQRLLQMAESINHSGQICGRDWLTCCRLAAKNVLYESPGLSAVMRGASVRAALSGQLYGQGILPLSVLLSAIIPESGHLLRGEVLGGTASNPITIPVDDPETVTVNEEADR